MQTAEVGENMSRSGRFLYMIADDPPLEKQPTIGCMTGILQMFDRHHVRGLHAHKRITAASPKDVPRVEYGPNGNDNGEVGVQPLRGSIDSPRTPRRMLAFKEVVTDSIQRDQGFNLPAIAALEKHEKIEAALQHCLSPDLRKRRSHRRVSSTESIELPSHSSPKLVSNRDILEAPRSSIESRESTSSRFFPLKERPRYSCDGREISRQPYSVDDKNAYRSSSLRAPESPRYLVDTSIKRPPNVVARLMGLDEMPGSLPLSNICSPRPAMWAESPKQSVSQARLKAQDKSSRAQEKSNSAQDRNHSEGLQVLENTLRKECNSMVETPRHQLQPEISKLQLQPEVPRPQLHPAQQNDPLHALFLGYENKRKVNIEDCDRDLQVLEKIVEAMKTKQSLRPVSASASPSRSADVDFPAKLEDRSSCSTPGRSESILSQRYGGESSLTSPRAAKKKCMVDDQKSSNIVRGKSVTRSRSSLSTDVSPRRSRLLPNKTLDEKCNSSQPLAYKPSDHYSLKGNEVIPTQKLKSPKVVVKEQRKKSGMEIRVEKKNMSRNESKNGSPSKFDLQNPKMKKSLDFRPDSKRLISKSTSNCKAQKRTADKSGRQEDIISITENPYEMKVEVFPEYMAEHPSQLPAEWSPVSVLDGLQCKEDISPWLLSKRALNFEGNDTRAPDNLSSKVIVNSDNLTSLKTEEPMVLSQKAKNQHHSAHMEPNSEDDKISQRQKDVAPFVSCIESQKNYCKHPEYNYVAELFKASGLLLKNREEDHHIFMQFYSPAGFSIDLQIFYDLEKKFKTLNGGHKNRMHRRLIFDTVNEILKQKSVVPPYMQPPHKQAVNGNNGRLRGEELLSEVMANMERLSVTKMEDIIDGVHEIVKKDVEVWGGEKREAEFGEVVLDLERRIFRDLMDELLFDFIF